MTAAELIRAVDNNPKASSMERALADALQDMRPAPAHEHMAMPTPVQLELPLDYVAGTAQRWLEKR
jgi:hypothetical protein